MKEQVSRKYIRECFKKVKVQLPEESLDDIVRTLRIQANTMAQRCKNFNVKRLTPNLMYLALGKFNHEKK